MKTVHKFIIAEKVVSIPMPKGARIISACNQMEKCMIYAEVDTSMPDEERTFHAINTGSSILEAFDYTFIGTVLLKGGTSVAHIYEIKKRILSIQNKNNLTWSSDPVPDQKSVLD